MRFTRWRSASTYSFCVSLWANLRSSCVKPSETQKEYVDADLQRVKRMYKERAGIALYAIDPKAADDTLRRLDEKERAELQKVIRAAFPRQPRTLQRPAARTPAP